MGWLSSDSRRALVFSLLNAALVLWVVLNGAWILFSRRRQSLLDRWLGLNVVLDTRGDRRPDRAVKG